MSDLLVECPIHLDAVHITDILVFKCGHGFCEPCLQEHFAHHAQNMSCPTCRKPVRRKEAFSLFLSPAQPSGSQPAHEAFHTRMMRELSEARAAHADCPGRLMALQAEIDTLRQDSAYHDQAMHHLRDRYDLLEGRLAREADCSIRAKEESNRMREEVVRLQVENHRISKALEDAVKDVQAQHERVKMFQGYTKRYQQKCNLEKKKRKAIENANHHLLPRKEDDSLMVVDSNAPDVLHQDEPDFGWLDEACKVKGDEFSIPGDGDLESERESEDEVPFSGPDTKENQNNDRDLGPSPLYRSDWNLGLETMAGPPSGIARRQRHGSKQLGGSRIVKVKMPSSAGTRKSASGPLDIDRQGRIRGTVILGSRQKFNSKN